MSFAQASTTSSISAVDLRHPLADLTSEADHFVKAGVIGGHTNLPAPVIFRRRPPKPNCNTGQVECLWESRPMTLSVLLQVDRTRHDCALHWCSDRDHIGNLGRAGTAMEASINAARIRVRTMRVIQLVLFVLLNTSTGTQEPANNTFETELYRVEGNDTGLASRRHSFKRLCERRAPLRISNSSGQIYGLPRSDLARVWPGLCRQCSRRPTVEEATASGSTQ